MDMAIMDGHRERYYSTPNEHSKSGAQKKKIFTLEDPSATEFLTIRRGDSEVSLAGGPRRPPLTRRHAVSQEDSPSTRMDDNTQIMSDSVKRRRRRWTLAMTMNDEGMTDENFVQELEKMATLWADADADDCFGQVNSPSDSEEEEKAPSVTSSSSHFWGRTAPTSTSSIAMIEAEFRQRQAPDTGWSSALRALLITRDLIRTEKNYLVSLGILLESYPSRTPDTLSTHTLPWPSKPAPEYMVTLLQLLIGASTQLFTLMQADPSVRGVASAFVATEVDLESAFVGWCSEVGGWYDSKEPREGSRNGLQGRRLSRSRWSTVPSDLAEMETEFASKKYDDMEATDKVRTSYSRPGTPPKRRHSTWRKSALSLSTLGLPTSPTGSQDALNNPHSPTFRILNHKGNDKMAYHSVRELGILPVQRITRYGLLFRGQLFTPMALEITEFLYRSPQTHTEDIAIVRSGRQGGRNRQSNSCKVQHCPRKYCLLSLTTFYAFLHHPLRVL
jgi:hypothetical protein